jgi:hypothetical protein
MINLNLAREALVLHFVLVQNFRCISTVPFEIEPVKTIRMFCLFLRKTHLNVFSRLNAAMHNSFLQDVSSVPFSQKITVFY